MERGSTAFLLLLLSQCAFCQLLEPRALTNVPIGMNFALAGYGYSAGNILLDPSIPIEDLDSRIHSTSLAYLRSISLFKKSAKMDAIIPMAFGRWEGTLDGQDSSRVANGLGDVRIRLSVNFAGAPALSAAEYSTYHQKTIFGASMQVFIPTGQYDPARLINLGTNRFTLRTQLGMSQNWGKWLLETYVSLWLFTANTNFINGNKLQQRPLLGIKSHLIRTLRKGRWMALDVGYGSGSSTVVNDQQNDNRISSILVALNFAMPLGKRHTLRLIGSSAIRLSKGSDYDNVSVVYQYRWIRIKPG